MGGSLQETTKPNPYVYAGDDPVNRVDPSGAFTCGGATAIVVALGVGTLLAVLSVVSLERLPLLLLALEG